jgi:hypothetical protein
MFRVRKLLRRNLPLMPGEDNTTEEVNDQPEVEESGEDSKVGKRGFGRI